MKKYYKSIEDFQDSAVYLKQKSPKFIRIFLLAVTIILILGIISIFVFEKNNYIEGDIVLSDEQEPEIVLSPEDAVVKKLNIKEGKHVKKGERLVDLDLKDERAVRDELIIKQLNNKIIDLQALSENIDTYPSFFKPLIQDSNVKQYYLFKEKYLEITDKKFEQRQINLLKAEYQQEISEKIEKLRDEIESLKTLYKNQKKYIEANSKGKIKLENNLQQGGMLKKGQIIGYIYPNKIKNIKMDILDSDIHQIKSGDKVNIKFKIGEKVIRTEGKVSKIPYFPNSSANNKNLSTIAYRIEIEVSQDSINAFHDIALVTGKGFIETEKETIAQYLYKKIKQ